jgi:uncharacterized protein with HEPN domain
MSDPLPDESHLADMLRYASLAISAAAGSTRADFHGTSVIAAAIERWVSIVGEAARRVSKSFQTAHPEIECKAIIATRHIITHEYGEVSYDILWRIVTIHLPKLVDALRPLVPTIPDE